MKLTLATAVLLALLSAHCAREAEEPRSTSRPAASPAEPAASRGGPPASRGGSAAHDHTAGEESAHGGAPERVTLSHDAIESAGIETVAVAHVTAPAELDAFGRVLDPMPIVDALHARAAARSAAATARAEHTRVVRLRADQQNASTRDVESARAARDRADAELATTTARVALAWGATIAAATPEDAFCDDLVAGRTAVARIDFAAGDHVEQMPATVTVSAAGRPDRQCAARVLGPAGPDAARRRVLRAHRRGAAARRHGTTRDDRPRGGRPRRRRRAARRDRVVGGKAGCVRRARRRHVRAPVARARGGASRRVARDRRRRCRRARRHDRRRTAALGADADTESGMTGSRSRLRSELCVTVALRG